ncbi:MAG: cyclic nucleotide-binding domain-containing protein [Anaerolineaceae bacterium]|nr:cyclic nucleotide-binding domain-containing protein [Anaerolineaceae bacterium]
MADRFVIANARRLPLFARLDAQQMDWVASVTQVLRYEPGEELFKQGEIAQGLLMIISGSGLLVQRGADGIERPFGKVSAGEFINDTALFNEITTQATLRASESTIALFLSRQQMRNLLAHHPEIKSNLNIPGLPKLQTQQVQQFQNQRENETTLLKTRRHIGALLARAVGIGIVILLVWFVAATFAGLVPGFPSLLLAIPVTILLGLLIAYYYAEWANDELIITDRRVVNIQRTILNFQTHINEIPLDAIHEVNVKLPALTDIAGRFLGYGSIIIKTSGDANNIRLDEIPNPKAVQQAIFTHRDNYQQAKLEENRNAMRGELVAKVMGGDSAAGTPANNGAPPGVTNRPGLFTIEYINEKGETVYRKHWFVLLTHLVPAALLFMGGFTLLLIGVLGVVIPIPIMLLAVFWGYLADWDWRNDMYIVGDQTVTIIHRRPLFLQDQKDQILLSQVDNVVSDTHGFMNSIFQIGDVKLMLVGTDEKNAKRFTSVFAPQRVQQEISRRQDRAAALKQQQEAQRQQQAIIDYLSVYHETVGTPPAAAPNGSGQGLAPAQPASSYSSQSAPAAFGLQSGNYNADDDSPQPPRVRDRSRPPGIPRVRRDVPPGT